MKRLQNLVMSADQLLAEIVLSKQSLLLEARNDRFQELSLRES
jgi:uncharacterized protein YaiI (UPF0178 family)